MFPWLLDQLTAGAPEPVWAALGKITFRASLAAMGSFALALLLGPRWIGWLKRRFRERVCSDSHELNRLHANKAATPTMGGLFVVGAVLGALLLVGRLDNPLLAAAIVVLVGLGAIGAIDDLIKLRGHRNGITARTKMAGQIAVTLLAAIVLRSHLADQPDGPMLFIPLIGGFSLGDLAAGGWIFFPLATLAMTGGSNAVNLTDGLDGLAGGCLLFATAAITTVAYASGHAEMAAYLDIPRIAGAGEMAVLGAAMIGAVLGFLWFNCHPAQVFLGDTGSLPLGGLLGLIAVAARQEFLLLILGGVFVLEALSVILQVGSFKLRSKRIFRCAPLHHHFQLAGMAEGKIVVRFWIAAALCAVVGLATLKVNIAPGHQPRPSHALPQHMGRGGQGPAVPAVATRSPEGTLR